MSSAYGTTTSITNDSQEEQKSLSTSTFHMVRLFRIKQIPALTDKIFVPKVYLNSIFFTFLYFVKKSSRFQLGSIDYFSETNFYVALYIQGIIIITIPATIYSTETIRFKFAF